MYQIIQKRKIWLTLSGVIAGLSIFALAIWGLNFGIDFTGGSLLEVRFLEERPATSDVQSALADMDLGSLIVQPVGEDGLILRFQDISEEKHQGVLKKIADLQLPIADLDGDRETEEPPSAEATEGKHKSTKAENVGDSVAVADLGEINISTTTATTTMAIEITDEMLNVQSPPEADQPLAGAIEELRFDSVGPSIGQELKQKSLTSIMLVLIAIVLYIAWVFRKVSKPVASWKYGLTAIIALFHDVIITLGIFAILGKFFGVEINTPFVAAILTVLGYSVNDTIVVFDRLRENLPKSEEDFEGTVNISVNQTIRRSINTSATTLLVLVSILIFGGGSIKDFVLALSIGVFIGTYSSIFLASPVLVVWEKMKRT